VVVLAALGTLGFLGLGVFGVFGSSNFLRAIGWMNGLSGVCQREREKKEEVGKLRTRYKSLS
jgi:hypothetical protein